MIPNLISCTDIVIPVAAEIGITANQERSFGTAIDDKTIWVSITESFVQEDVNELLASVSISVIEGRVLLTGSVKDPATRISAVRIAWQPEGVKEVINEIQVVEEKSAKQVLKDNWINGQLRGKLLLEEEIRSVNYTTDTVGGIVYLFGIAQDEKELNFVTNIASRIKGVEKVISHVRLKHDPSRQ